jgi:hypothetical protein
MTQGMHKEACYNTFSKGSKEENQHFSLTVDNTNNNLTTIYRLSFTKAYK